MPFIALIVIVALLLAVVISFLDITGHTPVSVFVAAIIIIMIAYFCWTDEDFRKANAKEPDSDVLVSVKEKWANKGEQER